MLTEIEDEQTWLRHRIMRMRTVLQFAKDPRAEAGMRELIADAERGWRRWRQAAIADERRAVTVSEFRRRGPRQRAPVWGRGSLLSCPVVFLRRACDPSPS
jgi:hypothetical protein